MKPGMLTGPTENISNIGMVTTPIDNITILNHGTVARPIEHITTIHAGTLLTRIGTHHKHNTWDGY